MLSDGYHSHSYKTALDRLAACTIVDSSLVDLWRHLSYETRLSDHGLLSTFVLDCLIHPVAEPAVQLRHEIAKLEAPRGREPHQINYRSLRAGMHIEEWADVETAATTLLDALTSIGSTHGEIFDPLAEEEAIDSARGIEPQLVKLLTHIDELASSFVDPNDDPTKWAVVFGEKSNVAQVNVFINYCALLTHKWCDDHSFILPASWPLVSNNTDSVTTGPCLSTEHYLGLVNAFFPITGASARSGRVHRIDTIKRALTRVQKKL